MGDPFTRSAPLVPDGSTSIVEHVQVGGSAWQSNKLVRDERRLEAVATKMGAKARAIAKASIDSGSQAFADLSSVRDVLDDDGNVVGRVAVNYSTENPQAEKDARILVERLEVVPAVRRPDAPAHVAQSMEARERVERDARLETPKRVDVYVSKFKLLQKGMRAISDARESLQGLGAVLSRGRIVMEEDEGGSIRLSWFDD